MTSRSDVAGSRVWVEVNLDAIRNNYLLCRRKLGTDTKIAAVVKANGYGHGALRVVQLLQDLPENLRPSFFAVATTDEALEIVETAKDIPILVLGHVLPEGYEPLLKNHIRLTVDTKEEVEAIARVAHAIGEKALIHMAVDTGMTRIGFSVSDDSVKEIVSFARMEDIVLEGMFSHFATADCQEDSASKQQAIQFELFVSKLAAEGVVVPLHHLCNSAAISKNYPMWQMVRLGISLYGLRPSFEVPATELVAKPAMSFYSRVVRVTDVPAGTAVSYGGHFVAKDRMTVATISAGYADGIHRSQAGGCVLIHGKKARILGTICMDQFMVDVTNIPSVKVEDVVTIFGYDGEVLLDTDEVAREAGTIGYELICSVSQRVPRFYFDKKK